MQQLLRNLFTLCVSMLCMGICAMAQSVKRPVRILTTKNGLPQSFISGLVQDATGFVWVGTRNGLARYDGNNFKVFLHSNKDSGSLSSNVIISLQKDSHQNIWIEHESGAIDKINPVTEKIEHVFNSGIISAKPIQLVRNGWLVDKKGGFWCTEAGNGLFRLGAGNTSVLQYGGKKTNATTGDTIRALLEDRQRNVWVLDQRFITRYTGSARTKIALDIPLDFDNYKDSESEIIALHERKNGELMFGDRQHLFFYHPASQKFRFISLPTASKFGVRWMQSSPDGSDYIECQGVVYRYDDKSSQLVPVADIANEALRDIRSFLIDRSGLVWLGTNAGGIHQVDLSQPFFTVNANGRSFHQDLLQKEMGIRLDEFAGWPIAQPNFNQSSYYFRWAYDASHRLWFALRNRVGYYKPPSGMVRLPPVPGVASAENIALGIRGLDFAPDGTLFVISDNGNIAYYDTVAKAWASFLPAAVFQKINKAMTLLDIVADDTHLWISTSSNGLISVDRQTRQLRQFNQKLAPSLLPTDILLGLLPDPTRPGLLWIGSYEGLTCLNKKTLKSETFLMQDGLPDNTIYALQADKDGFIWLGTNKGLCRFHPVTHQTMVFKTSDGLPGNEFNRFHSLLLPNGHMAFGGTDGWVEFDPTAIKVDSFQPAVAFTAVKINNQLASNLQDELNGAQSVNDAKELKLSFKQNTVAFDFAGLEFNQPQKLQYRYQLVGYDKDWVMAGNNPSANYTQLPPGSYVLKVNASNTTGQWSRHIKELPVVILPPLWRTWWAYAIYLLIVFGLVWGYVYYRVNKERLQQQIILKEREAVQLKAVEEVKNRFFSNVTHEFRTPLTLIVGPAQRLKETLKQADQQNWLSSIERNAQQLLRLVNQLLDISKLEAGKLEVKPSQGDLSEFISGLILPFRQEAGAQGIEFSFKMLLKKDAYWFDGDKLERIVGNLLSNAIKFTPEGGMIEIMLGEKASSDAGVEITVSDTGIGIPQNQLGEIFNRFHQVNNAGLAQLKNRQGQGTGIGLSLVKELVDLQGGTIDVQSTADETEKWRTRFTIWLPYLAADGEPLAEKSRAYKQASFKQIAPKEKLFTKQFEPVEELTIGSFTNKLGSLPTILLVEDNASLADFIADSLPAEYDIFKAVNGADGLQQALQNVPDLVISDVLMPVMDGYEFCQKLKADERTSHIPVIMLTAKASFDDKIEGLTGGADDYLTKPFHVEELRLRVNNLLERQNRLREWMRKTISQPGSTQVALATLPDEAAQDKLQNIFIQKLYAVVEEKLDENLFGVEEISTEMGMSRSSLHRKIKAVTGLSTSEVVRNYRLNRAADFLKKGHNSSETAYLVGFDSPAYFSKCFHEFYKITPTEFAQKAV